MENVDRLPAGTIVGGYRIVRLLGEGGMGCVYEAVHEVLGRRSAMKFLRAEYASAPEVVTRFTQEAQAVNLINHEHIVNIYDIGDGAGGSVYLVMELLDGKDLSDVQAGRPLPLPLLVHVYAQVMRALLAAHAKQIVHRDLKPANVFITRRDRNPFFVKVLDFGIAKLRDGSSKAVTRDGMVLGTPSYMSPEQIQGRPVDHRSDIFTLGIMLYRAATGVYPFRGDTFGALAAEIIGHEPPPIRAVVPAANLPPTLERLVWKALRKPADERYQSVAEMMLDLEAVRREAGLDDEALGAAIAELAGMPAGEVGPLGAPSPPTRPSLAESLPVFQGVPAAGAPPAVAATPKVARSSKVALVIGGVLGLAVAVSVVVINVTRDRAKPAVAAVVVDAAPAAVTYASLRAAGDAAAVRARAEAALTAAMAGNAADQATVVAALALIGSPRGAPLLYRALDGGPDVRLRAARALRELKLPEAAPKLRAAVEGSGDALRVELAAAMAVLGDRAADAILRDALAGEASGLVAAVALVEAGRGDATRPRLLDVYQGTPAGRERWRLAAGALARMDDAAARAALVEELAQPDPARALAAAEMLVRIGDEAGRGYLERTVADASSPVRPAAALALARAGGTVPAAVVAGGLASKDADTRMTAIATAARLGGGAHLDAIAALADGDPDPRVRIVAQAALWVTEP